MTGLLAMLVACDERTDWRIEPCLDEDETTCRFETIDVEGQERGYVLSPPAGFTCDGSTLWPVVFGWHGSGDNGAGFRADLFGRGFAEAWPDALWVFPDGLEREDTDGATGWDQAPDGDDVAFFDVLLAHLVSAECVDPDRVHAIGHSRGGRFIHTLGCNRSADHVGFASVGAGTPDDWDCADQAPMWLAHGTDDRVVPYAQGKRVRNHWRDTNGCASFGLFHRFDRNVCTPYEECDVLLEFCPYTDAEWDGHAIPDFAAVAIRTFFDGLPR